MQFKKFINNIINFFILYFKNLIAWAQKNPKNFTKFIIAWGLIAFAIRYVLLMCFSQVPPLFNKLFIFAILSILFSISIFYIKFHYSNQIKKILSKFIDIDRISSNIEKQNYVERVAKEENPHLKFWVLYLHIPIILLVYLWINSGIEIQSDFNTIIMFLFFSLIGFYTSYLRKIKLALENSNVPPEKIPVPSKFTVQRWYFLYVVKTRLKSTILRSPGTPSGGVLRAAEYVFSPEFQAKAKSAKSLAVYFSTIVGLALTGEAAVSSIAESVPPSHVLATRVVQEYYTFQPYTRKRFSEIKEYLPKEIIGTFCFPGTKKLDPRAVLEAYQILEDWKTAGNKRGKLPDLVGPHPPFKKRPVEDKESSFDGLMASE